MYRFFINRPIVAMVIAILQVVVGLVTMLSLPVAQYPNIVPPEIRIQTTYVGADAQTLAQSVATPIEEQMSGVDNMNYMYSVSANNGVMRMGVNFDVKTDPERRSSALAAPRKPGRTAIAGGRAQFRHHPHQIPDHAAHARGADLAQGHARFDVPGQLRLYKSG